MVSLGKGLGTGLGDIVAASLGATDVGSGTENSHILASMPYVGKDPVGRYSNIKIESDRMSAGYLTGEELLGDIKPLVRKDKGMMYSGSGDTRDAGGSYSIGVGGEGSYGFSSGSSSYRTAA